MRFKVIRNGLVERVGSYETGALLLHPREVWDRRFKRIFYRDMRVFLVVFGLPVAALVLFLFLLIAWFDISSLLFLATAATVVVPFVVLPPLVMWLVYMRAMHRVPARGVYEKGVMTYTCFVPYREIIDIDEHRQSIPLTPELTFLDLVFMSNVNRRWNHPSSASIDTDFLGKDGTMYILTAIRAAKREAEDPPRLVVYRGRGGMVEGEHTPEEGVA